MSVTVVTNTTETLPDGTIHTTTFYSDGSRSDLWAPPAGSPQANAQTLRDRAVQALQTNATYLGITSPSTAQNTAQVKALTREVNAVLRLLVVGTSSITDS